MTGSAAKQLGLERYLPLLEVSLGSRCQLALCDPDGATLWASDESGIGVEIEALFEEHGATEPLPGGTLGWTIDEDRVVLCERVHLEGGAGGWLALLADRSTLEGPHPPGNVSRALQAVAQCVAEDWKLQIEADQLAAEVEQRYEELNLVYSLYELPGNADGEFVARVKPLLERIARQVGVDLVALVTGDTAVEVHTGNARAELPELDFLLLQLRGDLLRFVTTSRGPVVLNEPDDPRRAFLLPYMQYRCLACPVTARGITSGALFLIRSREGTRFSSGDRSLVSAIGQQLGVMLSNHSMLARLRRFGEQLVASLISAIEAKDPYTRGHSERVQAIAVRLGEMLGLGRQDLEALYWSAILHDVGKIGIPDVILRKPAKLTDAEYTCIRTHPERSFEILGHVDYLCPASLLGVRHHHERVDGGGYPHGLCGAQIPLTARIIAVADTYDAMTSTRAYRVALGHDAATEEIARVAGTQLDREVATAFLGLCGDDPDWLARIRPETRRDG